MFSASELRKIANTAACVRTRCSHPLSAMVAFLDHVMPTGGTFSPVRNIYLEWKTFEVETLPSLEGLFPVTQEEEDGLSVILEDWKCLSKDLMHYRSVYCSPGRVGSMKLTMFYRNTKDFYRLLIILRVHQYEDMRVAYPLFTVRGFLAAQIESLSGYLDRLVVGNVVSEKARERHEDWYVKRYYPNELIQKAKSRPSENNPVCNSGLRKEYEVNRMRRGIRAGDHTFDEETPVPDITCPKLYFEELPEMIDDSSGGVVLPATMKDLLGGG